MEKIEVLEKNVASLMSEMTALKESVASGFQKIEGNFKKVEGNFEKVELDLKNLSKKVDDLSSGVDQLSSGTTNHFEKVDVKLDSLVVEIKKIGEVTRYESEYENLSIIEKQKRAN